jgi:hypothetical protein
VAAGLFSWPAAAAAATQSGRREYRGAHMTRSTMRGAGAVGLAALLMWTATGGTVEPRATAAHDAALAQFCLPQDDADSYRFYCRFSGG